MSIIKNPHKWMPYLWKLATRHICTRVAPYYWSDTGGDIYFGQGDLQSELRCLDCGQKWESDRAWVEHRLLKHGHCPDCRSKDFFEGPSGGLCTNIKCAGCGKWFNVAPGLYAERIALDRPHAWDAPVVETRVPVPLKTTPFKEVVHRLIRVRKRR